MSLAGIMGIAVVGSAIAIAWRDKRSTRPHSAQPSPHPPLTALACESLSVDSWCDALEQVTGGAVLCFDGTLRLLGAGTMGRGMGAQREDRVNGSNNARGLHLIDLAPPAAMATLLEVTAQARRGAVARRAAAWGDTSFSIVAGPLKGEGIILCLKENRCAP
jgi:hypothetical protein